MGISSDGQLSYGFDTGVESELPDWVGEYEDFEDWYFEGVLRQEGWKEGKNNDSYFEKKKEAMENCPISLELHCSYDYSMYLVVIKDYHYTASRGYPEEISNLEVDESKVDLAREFCKKNGIPWQEPKWLLTSLYG